MVDLALDSVVTDEDQLVEAGGLVEEVAVVGLVVGNSGSPVQGEMRRDETHVGYASLITDIRVYQ